MNDSFSIRGEAFLFSSRCQREKLKKGERQRKRKIEREREKRNRIRQTKRWRGREPNSRGASKNKENAPLFSGSVYIDYTREKEVEGRTKNEIVEKKIRSRKKEEESE